MFRTLLPPLLAGLLLLAAPAAAQGPLTGGAALTLADLPDRVIANATQHSQRLDLTFAVEAGTCPGGSQPVTITVAAEAEGNATVEVQPRTFEFTIGQSETAQDPKSETYTATIVVTAGAVRSLTEVPVNVTATSSEIVCSLAVFDGVPSQSATAGFPIEFYPVGGNTEVPPTDEPVPGFEVPVLLAALGGILLLRRRKT